MSTARQALTALLTEHLPDDVAVVPYATNLDAPQKDTVMLRLDEVGTGNARGITGYRFALILIGANAETGAGDDAVEKLLEDVLFSLDKVMETGVACTWVPPARRVAYGKTEETPTNPAFQVDVLVGIQKE